MVAKFLNFWGLEQFAGVSHLDVRQFIAESSSRDLSAEVNHAREVSQSLAKGLRRPDFIEPREGPGASFGLLS